MDRMACTELHCLYKGDLYLTFTTVSLKSNNEAPYLNTTVLKSTEIHAVTVCSVVKCANGVLFKQILQQGILSVLQKTFTFESFCGEVPKN